MDDLSLLPASTAFGSCVWNYRQEFLDSGEYIPGSGGLGTAASIVEWGERLRRDADETIRLPEFVPAATFLAVRVSDGRLVGMVNIRKRLNDWLLQNAGHIGYSVRPAERGRGYATEMLRLTLRQCARFGIPRALVCCFAENAASTAVIRANGGVLENTVVRDGRPLQRYWIKTQKQPG